MSSAPDSPAAPQGASRHTYDSLFGDPPEPPDAAPAAATPTSYDDPPGDEEPYLPPNARAQDAPPRPNGQPAPAPALDLPGTRSPAPARQVGLDLSDGDAESVRAAHPVDTGRLYHSSGIEGPATGGAIPALPRTGPAPDAPAPAPVPAQPPAPARMEGVAPRAPVATAAAVAPAQSRTDRGLTYLGVVAIVGVPTLLAGLLQGLLGHTIGWPTGLVLALTTIYAALSVRRADFSAAIVVPPLAFLVTTLVAGQLTLTEGGSFLVRQSFMIVRTLAENAPWVLGSTLVAAVIVLVRRRRA